MTGQTEVLALVPARGGSKGIPRKNLRTVGGESLLARAVATAFEAEWVRRVVVSTDDDQIAAASLAAGAEVVRRPVELAADETPDLPVLRHSLAELRAAGYVPEAVAWLRPTAPLRTAADVDAAIELLLETGADSVRSVCAAEHHPWWTRRIDGGRLLPFVADVDPGRLLRRQDLPEALRLNGAVDVIRTASVPASGAAFETGDVRAYVMPVERSLDIDSELDLELADLRLRRSEGRP